MFFLKFCIRIRKNIEARNIFCILGMIHLRISKAGIRIWGKNILRVFQAQFSEKVKNTQARRNFHHFYNKKRVM